MTTTARPSVERCRQKRYFAVYKKLLGTLQQSDVATSSWTIRPRWGALEGRIELGEFRPRREYWKETGRTREEHHFSTRQDEERVERRTAESQTIHSSMEP